MDPLSLAASAAGLASFALQAFQVVDKYIRSVADASETVREICQELRLTASVLERLNKFLIAQARQNLTAVSPLDPDSVLPTAITSCLGIVKNVSARLERAQRGGFLRVRERLKWPFTEGETRRRVDGLRGCVATFAFSLTVEGCNLLSQTSEDVKKTLDVQLHILKNVLELTSDVSTMSSLASEASRYSQQLKSILLLVNDFSDTVGGFKKSFDDVHILKTRSDETRELQILNWLSSNEYARKHHDMRARRFRGTGQWLLDDLRFQAWLDATNPILMCTGDPGVGKSVLTSLVIDHIVEQSSTNNLGLAYFYFEFAKQHIQTPENLVGSLLRQLAFQAPSFPAPLAHFYQRFKEDEAHGSTVELLLILKGVCQCFNKCFIVIDALDECQKAFRPEILRHLTDLKGTPVQVFVTSRPHPHDIKYYFGAVEYIEVAASLEDIRTYCVGKINENEGTCDLIDDELKVEITESISRNAKGMFLLPVLQMQSILEAMTRAEIRKSINHLSVNLGEAFRDTLRRIESEADNRRFAAKRALMWTLHSCRPLQIDELRYALAIEIGSHEFDADNVLQGRRIVDCCLGLIVIDDGSSVVRFVHDTLRDYLHHERQDFFNMEETEITQSCLTYLNLEVIPELELDHRGFLDYAAIHWGHHAEHAIPDAIEELALSFLTNDENLARTEKHLRECPPSRTELVWHRQIKVNRMTSHENVTGLHVAAAFGLTRIIQQLLKAGQKSNAQDSRGNTPLHEAASNGQMEATTMLLGHGAHPDMRNHDGNTALFLAVSFAFTDIVLLLLRQDADPNLRCVDGWTALHEAVDKGHLEIVRVLLEHGASIHLESARGLVVLHRAAGRGHIGLIRMLLDSGSPIDTVTKDQWTPLHGAASSGQFEAVKLLLGEGAFIDHQSSEGRTSLHRACRGGHYLTVRTLLDKGANHLIPDSGNNLPLHRAAKGGHLKIAKLLLEHNPSAREHQMSAQQINGRTPRAEALYSFHRSTATMLRDEEGSETPHPLDVAVEEGNLEKVDELLLSGVDVNRLSIDGYAPLHQAYSMENECLINLLIQKKANFNLRTSNGWTPLHCAARTGNESAVRQCLDHGADINATTDDGQTALHKVCKSGFLPTTRILIERGANLEASDKWGWRPAHTAASAGFKDLVELLINAGARMDTRDKDGRTLQACASGNGHHALAEFLRIERHKIESAPSQNAARS